MKPSIGLPVEELRIVVRELAEAGIDFIKDDELMGNPPHSPLADRVAVVTEELDKVAARTGTAADVRVQHHRRPGPDGSEPRPGPSHAGGTCVMVCVNLVGSQGSPGCGAVRAADPRPPRDDRGVHQSPGVGNRLRRLVETRPARRRRPPAHERPLQQVLRNRRGGSALDHRRPATTVRRLQTLPVLSSGQWAGLAPETYRQTGTTDLLVLAGGGIHGHPGGPAPASPPCKPPGNARPRATT